jgi:hypothetical protein
VTAPQTRRIFSELLRKREHSPAAIARAVSRVLRRTAESRIYSYYSRHNRLPPLLGKTEERLQ